MAIGVHVSLAKAPKAVEGRLVGEWGIPAGDVEPGGQLQPLGQLEHGGKLDLLVVGGVVLQVLEPGLDRLVNDLGVLVEAGWNVGPVVAVLSRLGQPREGELLHPGHLSLSDQVVKNADVGWLRIDFHFERPKLCIENISIENIYIENISAFNGFEFEFKAVKCLKKKFLA